eukprot:scaffold147980_cov20-Prasinocladus_malaysianus.AAC.2
MPQKFRKVLAKLHLNRASNNKSENEMKFRSALFNQIQQCEVVEYYIMYDYKLAEAISANSPNLEEKINASTTAMNEVIAKLRQNLNGHNK